MSMFRSPSIQARALILGLLPSGLLLVALLFFFTSVRLQDAQANLISKGELLAAQIATAAEYDLIAGNSTALQRLTDRTRRYPWVVLAEIRDDRGARVAYSPSEVSVSPTDQVITVPILQSQVKLESDPFTEFSGLIDRSGSAITDRAGEVRLVLAGSTLAQMQARILYNGLSIALVMLLIALILVRALVNSISVPLESVYGALLRMADGHYDEAIQEKRTSGQLEDLIRATNRLSGTLKQKDEALLRQLRQTDAAREQAERASTAKADFLALMSHELKTPLNGVMGMLGLLQDTPLTADQKDFVRTAMRSASHLQQQINDVLNLSLLDQGKLNLVPVPTFIQPLIDQSVSAYADSANEKGVEFEVTHMHHPHALRVMVDPQRFSQMIGSLIAHAVKVSSDANVSITSQFIPQTPVRMTVVIDVKDQGPRLPEALIERWSTNSDTPLFLLEVLSSGSLSIGLVVVAGLANAMGGRLHLAASESEKGMHYQLILPLPVAGPCVIPDQETSELPQFKGRVLVVEDNLVNQKVTQGLLRKLGLETEACYDGRQALSALENTHFDLVIMDCQMPVMDGLEAAREIRRRELDRGGHRIPIIALTANTIEGASAACQAAGMDDFIEKPVRKEQLAAVLSKWLAISAESGRGQATQSH